MFNSTITRFWFLLVVDDNPMMRSFLASFFWQLGYYVAVADDGLKALAMLKDVIRPDVIICDLDMPRLGGLGLLKKIKADPLLCEIPFVALGSPIGSHDRIQSLSSGASEVISKPFNPVELEMRVKKLLPQDLPQSWGDIFPIFGPQVTS